MRDDHERPWHEGVAENGDHRGGIVARTGQEVQDRDQQNRHRPIEVQMGTHRLVGEDRGRVARVARNGDRRLVGQQRAGMRQDDRIVVHVGHTGVRHLPAGDLMHGTRGRKTHTDVEVVSYPAAGQIPNGAAEERPACPCPLHDPRGDLRDLIRRLAVSGPVVLASHYLELPVGCLPCL